MSAAFTNFANSNSNKFQQIHACCEIKSETFFYSCMLTTFSSLSNSKNKCNDLRTSFKKYSKLKI